MDLITENKLLQYHVNGLTEAIHNKKKKRRRGKPLFAQLGSPEQGKAIFYSPAKIWQARELQEEQERAKHHEQALKAEEKLQQELQKEEKRRIVEERKQHRAQSKIQRDKEAAALQLQKQAAKETLKANRQLKNKAKKF